MRTVIKEGEDSRQMLEESQESVLKLKSRLKKMKKEEKKLKLALSETEKEKEKEKEKEREKEIDEQENPVSDSPQQKELSVFKIKIDGLENEIHAREAEMWEVQRALQQEKLSSDITERAWRRRHEAEAQESQLARDALENANSRSRILEEENTRLRSNHNASSAENSYPDPNPIRSKALSKTEENELLKSSIFEEKQVLLKELEASKLGSSRLGARVKELELQVNHMQTERDDSMLVIEVNRNRLSQSEKASDNLRSQLAVLERKLSSELRDRVSYETSLKEGYEKHLTLTLTLTLTSLKEGYEKQLREARFRLREANMERHEAEEEGGRYEARKVMRSKQEGKEKGKERGKERDEDGSYVSMLEAFEIDELKDKFEEARDGKRAAELALRSLEDRFFFKKRG